MPMRWATAISEAGDTAVAVTELADRIAAQLDGEQPSMVLVFASPHHNRRIEATLASWAERIAPGVLVGCSAGGVVGEGHEVEQRRAIAAIAASMPGVTVGTFSLAAEDTPDGDDPDAWENLLGAADEAPKLIVLSDPFSFDIQEFVAGVDGQFPGAVVVGGIASGGQAPGKLRLFDGQSCRRSGAVGVVLRGPVEVHTVVAQGCRPIGAPMLVTEQRGNVITALGGKAPVQVLRELYEELAPRDQSLFRHSLFVGIEMTDRVEYQAGDFLIRHIVGMDPDNGAIAVNGQVQPWSAVQFHLRDARTSRQDLDAVLQRFNDEHDGLQPAGALMFSCLGRGLHLYQRPDHDTDLFRQHMGEVPLAGFFCNGEIGPVGGRTFLHGYTSVFALFSALQQAPHSTEIHA